MRQVSRTEFALFLREHPAMKPSAYESSESAGMQWIGDDGRVWAHARYVRSLSPRYELMDASLPAPRPEAGR